MDSIAGRARAHLDRSRAALPPIAAENAMGGRQSNLDICEAIRHADVMMSDQLYELLLAALIRRYGGVRRGWQLAMGPLRIHAVETHPHCNWSIHPSGTIPQNAAIERLLDEMRGRHPIVIPR